MSQRLIDNGYDLNLYKRNNLNNDDKKKYFLDPVEAVSDCDGHLICVNTPQRDGAPCFRVKTSYRRPK